MRGSCTELLERRDLFSPGVRPDRVYRNTLPICEAEVDQLRNSLEASIMGGEVYIGCPVVGEVRSEAATSACAFYGRVVVDGWYSGLDLTSANYPMIVWCS
jgi:hypothetical protein